MAESNAAVLDQLAIGPWSHCDLRVQHRLIACWGGTSEMGASVRERVLVAAVSAWLGAFVFALAAAQGTERTSDADRGYPVEAAGSGSGVGASSSVFGAVGAGAANVAPAQGDATATARDQEPGKPGKTFGSPEAAVKAFIDALRAGDDARLETIFGSGAHGLLSSGDKVADQTERATFLRYFDRQHSLKRAADGSVRLVVGESAWPFAVPIGKVDGGYAFDSTAGTRELVFRRVSRNERDAVAVCKTFVSAQKEYAQAGHDGLPPGLYARKLGSDAGKQNGLFWPASSGGARSPAGPLLAEAAEQGYGEGTGRSTPFRGYLYRVLTAQGDGARDGARSYIDKDGKQSGGFALIAYPAEYGRSGVKSFIVNQDSIVYEKDLGDRTLEAARTMQEFDPQGWRTAL